MFLGPLWCLVKISSCCPGQVMSHEAYFNPFLHLPNPNHNMEAIENTITLEVKNTQKEINTFLYIILTQGIH